MKLRVRFAKQDRARFFSHLDVQRTLERTLRRAALPIAYSQGFNPHPRMSFASALATGTSSEGEFIDVETSEPVPPAEFVERANRCLPPGVRMVEAREVPPKGDSLFSLVDTAEYRLTLRAPSVDVVNEAVAAFMGRESVEVEKEGKRGARVVNIREQVYTLEVEGGSPDSDSVSVRAVLQSGAQGSLKPETLWEGLVQVCPGFAAVEFQGTHRLMIYRRNPRSGELELPWDL
ncbi:MAG TPA: TIGR03936 family radical SAM-associated protein [Symbiobacteriaceae bacterium]|nr:TIGR03936 family radical SAM-associated protein [Symbiobacteriaceae bacterium]